MPSRTDVPDGVLVRPWFGPVTVRVANAPVSFGIYQAAAAPVAARELLAELAAAGYDGVDSGPIGYISADDLLQTGLGLAGGWVDLRYADAAGFADDLAGLRAALAAFTAIPVDDPRFLPRPTLACLTQIHIKDANTEILTSAGDLTSAVAAGCFPPLGRGEVDIAGFVAALRDAAYEGWIVVEQDAPAAGQNLDMILADQRANREYLRSVGR
jgi:sugar phosphate isomerase/epimerase